MNRMCSIIVAIVLFSEYASGGAPSAPTGLNELINKNVLDATRAYKTTLPPAEEPTNTAQLWVHVRSSQKKLAQEILDRVAKIDFGQWKIEQQPIQTVSSGPDISQLRYFKRQDKTQAQELFKVLSKLIPNLKISDLSSKYENFAWIKSGHYELWLSPNLTRLQPQRAGK